MAQELMEFGDFLNARERYFLAIKQDPTSFAAHYGLGMSHCAEAIYKTELDLATPADWYPAIYHTTLASRLKHSNEMEKTLAILHFNLGAQYKKRGDNGAAIPRLEQALSYDNTLLKALNLLGAIYHQAGDFTNARLSYKRIIALQSDYAIAHFNLGAAAWAMGDFASAKKHFQQALLLDSGNVHFQTWFNRAADRVGQ